MTSSNQKAGRWSAGLLFLILCVAPGCQDMRAFVTGDPFDRAPRDAARVEVEVFVDVQATLFDPLDGVELDDELYRDIADRVLALADVGMRFYPILSQDYGPNDAHPEHVMFVQVRDLHVRTEDRVERAEGAEGQVPVTRTTIDRVECAVRAAVEKRRDDAPALIIGQSPGLGRIRPERPDDAVGSTFRVRHATAELAITRDDFLRAVEKAVVNALREVVEPVDRELMRPQPVSAR